jgi:Glyoxalase-like domain
VPAAVFDAHDVEALAVFWAVVVGTTSLERWSDARGTRFVQVAGEPVLLFQEAPDSAGNGSLHLDVTLPVGTSQAEEVVRLVAAGAAGH